MVIIAVFLFWLGLCAGSFVGALVWRLHEQAKPSKPHKKTDLSILKGRSVCENCRHVLAWYDLIPLFSWLTLRGRCRYCKKSMSAQHLVVELLAAAVFALSYLCWPQTVHLNGQWLLLGTWLVASVGLLALAVYDIRWMILPNRIIYPTLSVAVIGRVAYIAAYGSRLGHLLLLWVISVAVASGVFYILFIASQGKWIGFGDVRLGLITGTLLADPSKSLAMIFLASVLGTIVVLPSLLYRSKSLASKIPYGPFLIASTGIMVVFGDSLISWYKRFFGL